MAKDKLIEFEIVPTNELFYNDTSCYGIYNFTTNSEQEHLQAIRMYDNTDTYIGIVAGNMQQLNLGLKYKVNAYPSYSEKYKNWQYTISSISPIKPSTMDDNKTFLNALLTSKQTDTILDAYPTFIDDVLNGKKIDVSLLSGIGEKTLDNITKKIIDNYVIYDILVLFAPLELKIKQIHKLMKIESNPFLLKQKMMDNPYIVTRLSGFGFKKVDSLALKINPDLRYSSNRIYALFYYILSEVGNNSGHSFIKKNKLLNYCSDNLKEDFNDCLLIINEIIENEEKEPNLLKIIDSTIGLLKNYNLELSILENIIRINSSSSPIDSNISREEIEEAICHSEKSLGFSLEDEQKNAIRNLTTSNSVIITANAGGGKSTVIKTMYELFKEYNILSCALSAKACQRIIQITNKNASTIHRLLGFKNGEFQYNKNNKLVADVVVIDEASMINLSIFNSLLDAIPDGCKLIIVFDNGQLPPIGCGNVATDLLNYTNMININKFIKFHRQSENSNIVVDANMIRQNKSPIDSIKMKILNGDDMFYLFRSDRDEINKLLIQAYLKAVARDGINNSVLILPRTQKCTNSTREINQVIQNKLIVDEVPFLKFGEYVYKLGARVICKKNTYEKNALNGEMGYLTDIWKDKNGYHFTVTFDTYDDSTKEIEFDYGELQIFELGYALSIHSSQGSEWKSVVIGLDNTHYKLLNSCLLYTAITRASEKCMIVAEPTAFQTAISQKGNNRHTYMNTYFIEQFN